MYTYRWKPKIDVPTRWLSLSEMITRGLKIRANLETLRARNLATRITQNRDKFEEDFPDVDDWKILLQLSFILRLTENVLRLSEGERYVSMAMAYHSVGTLLAILEDPISISWTSHNVEWSGFVERLKAELPTMYTNRNFETEGAAVARFRREFHRHLSFKVGNVSKVSMHYS